MGKIIAIANQKGGVGKTLSAVNLAVAARNAGESVVIFDGDLGLANVDVVLGLHGRYNINDVLEGIVEINDVILKGPLGIDVIPSGSGFANLADLSFVKRVQLLQSFERLNQSYDLMIVDTGAGISEGIIHMNSISDEIIVVTTSEPHSMTDAYATIKVLLQKNGDLSPKLLVNSVKSKEEGIKVWRKISDVANRFLNKQIEYLGCVPFDSSVQDAVRRQCVASEKSTHTLVGQEWNKIFGDLKQMKRKNSIDGYFRSFLTMAHTMTV